VSDDEPPVPAREPAARGDEGRAPSPFAESLCHACAGRRYVPARASTFVMCTRLEEKYPRQPVRACAAFSALPR
jgi:hypothetical protein